MCGLYHVTVPQEDDVAAQDQAESLGDSIADHLEPLVKDVAVQVNFLLNNVAVQVQRRSRLKARQSMLMNAMAVHNSRKKMTSFLNQQQYCHKNQ